MSAAPDFDPFGPPGEDQPSIPAVSWKDLPVGTVKHLTVDGAADTAQETVYGTSEKATWADGKPKMAVVIPVTEDGGIRNYWIPVVNSKGSTFNRFRDALSVGGYAPIAPGDVIHVKLADQVPSGKGNPRNVFDFVIERGAKPANDPFASVADEPPF